MIKNFQIYVKKISFVCACILLFIACEDGMVVKEYYYKIYCDTDSLPCSYQAVKIFDRNNIRTQIAYEYSNFTKEIRNKEIKYYKLTNNSMFLLKNINDDGKLYLSIEHIDSCIRYNYADESYNQIAALTHCYLGEKRIKLSEDNYIESYEFCQEYGLGIDGTEYRTFYDKSFIPIKMKYVSGYSPIDSIIRTDFIPSEFELLLNREQEWKHPASANLQFVSDIKH